MRSGKPEGRTVSSLLHSVCVHFFPQLLLNHSFHNGRIAHIWQPIVPVCTRPHIPTILQNPDPTLFQLYSTSYPLWLGLSQTLSLHWGTYSDLRSCRGTSWCSNHNLGGQILLERSGALSTNAADKHLGPLPGQTLFSLCEQCYKPARPLNHWGCDDRTHGFTHVLLW